MRTAELIALLRSHDRNKPPVREHLASLDSTRQLHLLGELTNWLLVELHKYQDRQGSPKDLETLQQGSIHSQIRHTLQAIITVLHNVTFTSTTNGATSISSGTGASSSPTGVKQVKKTALPLGDRDKEKILDNFLTPILIGAVPFGPRIDSTDVQHMCAKILSFCTNPLTINAPFPPQDFAKRMMTMSPPSFNPASSSSGSNGLGGHQKSNGASTMKPRRGADVVLALSSLLQSSSIKLQEYGLRILTSHRFIVQEDLAWEILPALRPVLDALKDDLTALLSGSFSILLDEDVLESTSGGGARGKSNGQGHSGGANKSDDSPVGIRSRVLLLLQSFLQEAGRRHSSLTPLSSSSSPSLPSNGVRGGGSSAKRLERLQEAAPMSLLVKLWTELQQIFFFNKAALPSCDRLVLVLCGAIYWECWIFQDEAMAVLLDEGKDTLLAWYGYYITTDDQDQEHQNGNSNVNGMSNLPLAQATAPKHTTSRPLEVLKHRASVLEYLTKLIVNLVSNKNNHATLYSGDRSVGSTIVRRTIEFFGEILSPETSLGGTTTSTATGANAGLSSPLPANDDYDARFLKHDGAGFWIENNVTWNEWTLGYKALVDRILRPLEQEVEARAATGGDGYSRRSPERTPDEETGLKALKLFALFWKHHPKGRWLLSDLFGPRFFCLRMLHVLADMRADDAITATAPTTAATAGRVDSSGTPKWIQERTVLLVDTAVYFGVESNVRYNMRERWRALPFLVALLGASVRRLGLRGYSIRETHCRRIAQRCFFALRNFWLDRQGLEQLVELDLGWSEEDEALWWSCMPSAIKPTTDSATTTAGPAVSSSIVPLLWAILAPPRTEWSSDLVLGCLDKGQPRTRGSLWWHPLFKREESLLVEASQLLAKVSHLPTCQHRLVSKPGVIWMLSRMMVERSLVGTSLSPSRKTGSKSTDIAASDSEQIEKALFETLTKVMAAEESAKAVVSNNAITELFAAILEMDRPLRFYRDKMNLQLPIRTIHHQAQLIH
ncbi:hypothetical protein BGX29_006984 [Mortierella sp. GBA35]|nr:hypothetical protein BGX29_006984 [Mortierella sp. GBA35]